MQDIKKSVPKKPMDTFRYKSLSNENTTQTLNSDREGATDNKSFSKSTVNLSNRREEKAFSSLYGENKGTLGRPKIDFTFIWGKLSLGLILFFFIFILLYSFVLDKAHVLITPIKIKKEVDQKIVLKDFKFGENILLISATSSADKKIERRGVQKVETKSSGTIVVYNNFDSKVQRLITNTRFEGTNGKIYKIDKEINVPGMKDGVPGSVEAKVYADSTGEINNADLMDFTIPGLKGSPRYDKFYARSKTKMTGGASGEKQMVAESDIALAEKDLFDDLKTKSINTLGAQIPKGFILVRDSVVIKESNNKDVLMSDESAPFTLNVIAEGVVVSNAYLAEAVLENTHKGEGLIIANTDDLKIESNFKDLSSQKDSNKVEIAVKGALELVSDLDIDKIKEKLLGSSKDDFGEIMSKYTGIEKANPTFSPFWSRSFSKDAQKIRVEIAK
jgi:hypothetical protein